MLAKLHILARGLKGTWLVLAADEAVRAAAAEYRIHRPLLPRCQGAHVSHAPREASDDAPDDVALQSARAHRNAAQAQDSGPAREEGVDKDSNVKVIALGGRSYRGGAAQSFQLRSVEVSRLCA